MFGVLRGFQVASDVVSAFSAFFILAASPFCLLDTFAGKSFIQAGLYSQ
jgi:hypothetical protein